MRQVEGWLHPESAEVMGALLEHQLRAGISGGVAEIGVHHGKAFILLANGLREDERGVAVDVFDDQHLNLDNSGRGDRAAFETNLAAWAPEADVTVVQSSSLDLEPASATATLGRVRMMSIDGGHTAEITEHDLRLAEASLVEQGVVVLDDVLNAHWLGVVSGLASYLSAGGGLVPFALSENKLYLAASEESARTWATVMRRRVPDLSGKRNVPFLGHRVDVYGLGSRRRREAAAAESALRDELAAQRRANRRLRRRAERAEQQVRAIQGSRSWRLTSGLRRMSKLRRKGPEPTG
jgi:hypothetical protein